MTDLERVKNNPLNIKDIKNPSLEVQLAAVKVNGWAIQYVKNPSLEVQLTAVRQNGYSIEYIKTPKEINTIIKNKHLNLSIKELKSKYPEFFV